MEVKGSASVRNFMVEFVYDSSILSTNIQLLKLKPRQYINKYLYCILRDIKVRRQK